MGCRGLLRDLAGPSVVQLTRKNQGVGRQFHKSPGVQRPSGRIAGAQTGCSAGQWRGHGPDARSPPARGVRCLSAFAHQASFGRATVRFQLALRDGASPFGELADPCREQAARAVHRRCDACAVGVLSAGCALRHLRHHGRTPPVPAWAGRGHLPPRDRGRKQPRLADLSRSIAHARNAPALASAKDLAHAGQ